VEPHAAQGALRDPSVGGECRSGQTSDPSSLQLPLKEPGFHFCPASAARRLTRGQNLCGGQITHITQPVSMSKNGENEKIFTTDTFINLNFSHASQRVRPNPMLVRSLRNLVQTKRELSAEFSAFRRRLEGAKKNAPSLEKGRSVQFDVEFRRLLVGARWTFPL
jgi:hypothetical protein